MGNNKNFIVVALTGLFVGLAFSFRKKSTPDNPPTPTEGGLDKNRPTGVTFAVFNKNLGNIRNAGRKYAGEITPTGNIYKKFDSWENGAGAMIAHLQRYINGTIFNTKLNTITKIINVYAPPSENDSRGYIAFVARESGIGANDVLESTNSNQMWRLSKAMTRMEDSKATLNYTEGVFAKGFEIAKKQNY
jgi:hypothetical protein